MLCSKCSPCPSTPRLSPKHSPQSYNPPSSSIALSTRITWVFFVIALRLLHVLQQVIQFVIQLKLLHRQSSALERPAMRQARVETQHNEQR
jgi:hypothetical protein